MTIESPKFKKGYFEKKAKEYNIFGKKLTPERKMETVAYLAGRKEGAMKPIEGEYKKSKEEIKAIDLIKNYLNQEMGELGVNRKADFIPEQFHFLPKDVYRRKFGADLSSGHVDQLNQATYINKDEHKKRVLFYNVIFHEAVHMASIAKFKRVSPRESKPIPYRSGYQVVDIEKRQQKLRGLNEMITDEMVFEIVGEHIDELAKELNLSSEERDQRIPTYPRKILQLIIEKVSQNNGENEEDTWGGFKKGLFTGEMMHLRDVERTFGKGSLEVLSLLKLYDKTETLGPKAHEKVLNYFQTDDEKEREKMINQLLPELEKSKEEKFDEGKILQEK